MVRRARHFISTVGAILLLCAQQAPAHAGTWCAPVGEPELLLGFGERYAASTHRGVDLAAAPGAEVSAPVEGTIVFAGRVPADGGGTCGAVTVELPEGLRVSLLPLDAVFVTVGESVAGGDALGVLASAGDDSSAATHLHLGLRRGDVYIDPAGYLPLAPPQTEADPGTYAGSAAILPRPADVAVESPGLAHGSVHPSPTGVEVTDPMPSAVGVAPSAVGDLSASASRAVADTTTGSVIARPLADPEAVPTSAAIRPRIGGSVLADAGLPVPSALDPHRPRAYVRGASGAAAVPAAPFGVAILLAAVVGALALLVPWRVALARVE